MIDEKSIVPKGDQLTTEEYIKWSGRIKFAHTFHKKQLIPKYKRAKKRYDNEDGYVNSFKVRASHTELPFLNKDIRNFIGSIFFRNPQVDFSSRNEEAKARRSVENLEQSVNDDVKDNRTLKRLIRSCLLDESLSGLGAVYIDYDYQDEDSIDEFGQPRYIMNPEPQQVIDEFGNPSFQIVPSTDEMNSPMIQRDIVKDEVCIYKIRPENIIRPPFQTLYNYKDGPYLGYAEIINLDDLKMDSSLDQEVVASCKGKEYKELLDRDLHGEEDREKSQDTNFILKYTVFIRDSRNRRVMRLVIADGEDTTFKPLSYGVWNKGHGKDGLGFPVHILALNEAADGFIPPSEAWQLESLFIIMDYLFKKMNAHLKRAGTRTYVKTGSGGVNKEELYKQLRNIDLEVIGLKDVPGNIPIDAVIKQVVDQALGQDHAQMFSMAKSLFEEFSRQPSFSNPEVMNKSKTATESNLIQMQDNTINGDYIDKFKDFWIDLFIDWGRLLQNNMQGTRETSVRNKITGEQESREYGADEIQGEFNIDVNIDSFMAPNKEVKRMIAKATLADMMSFQPQIDASGYDLNVKKCVDEYAENVDMRNPDELLIEKPIRRVDQQVLDLVTKGIPFNGNDLGGDLNGEYKRLVELGLDDAVMDVYMQLRPTIHQEVEDFAKAIQAGIQGVEPAPPKDVPQAMTDVGMGAAQMGSVA